MVASFRAFADKVKFHWNDEFFFVESNGIPDHPMMVGITSWQQQVPLPQKYTGDNAWRIPLNPVPARNPLSTKNRFLRGAIALAPNGVPIFNPLNNRGDDAYLFGELDNFGGHCGRADDYHYHLAPVHLEKTIGKGLPIAYALDGYPIHGYSDPDGSKPQRLDAFNGHDVAQIGYHYHASKTYPYLNGGFHGEVVERGGQVDPQPRAEPVREAGTPLRGARIVDFSSPKPGSGRLTYELRGRKHYVNYALLRNGAVTFEFVDDAGRSTSQTYQARGPRGARDEPPPPRDDDRPPPPEGGRRPKPPLITALDKDNDGALSAAEIARAPAALKALDRNRDGTITDDELRPPRPGDENRPPPPAGGAAGHPPAAGVHRLPRWPRSTVTAMANSPLSRSHRLRNPCSRSTAIKTARFRTTNCDRRAPATNRRRRRIAAARPEPTPRSRSRPVAAAQRFRHVGRFQPRLQKRRQFAG